MTDYRKKFISDSILITSGNILVYAKGIILLPILIKNAGINIYGSFVLLKSALNFLFGISSFGVGFKFKRYMPSTKERIEQRNIFYPQLYFNILTAIIISAILYLLDKRRRDKKKTQQNPTAGAKLK